jgi:hypothetical protein
MRTITTIADLPNVPAGDAMDGGRDRILDLESALLPHRDSLCE